VRQRCGPLSNYFDHLLNIYYFAGTPIGSSHDIAARWAGSAMVPVSSRSHPVNRPSPSGSRLPPPPSYQVATQSSLYNVTSPKHVTIQPRRRHDVEQHTPVTSPHVRARSSLPVSQLGAAVTARDRKMSFQVDSSTWKDREPTHFRWNMAAIGRRDNPEFRHKLPTFYDEVTSSYGVFTRCDRRGDRSRD